MIRADRPTVANALAVLLSLPSLAAAEETTRQDHPFLICTRDQFPELRERADEEPWASMKENALRTVADGPESIGTSRGPIRLQKFLGASALAYIVAPEDRPAHADRVREKIVHGLADVEFDEAQDWSGVVPPMAAAFVATIALDVVYDDLTDPQVEACEDVIERQIAKIDASGAWPLAREGTHGTWEVYTGERTSADDAYYKAYVQQMTEDGVTTVATTYAWARLASHGSRPQKTGYADVLEFTGVDERYYDHPRLENFYQWLYGSSVTPARQVHAFGDFIPDQYSPGSEAPELMNPPLAYRVGRFDPLAARYMAWGLKDRKPPGHILAYVLKRRAYEAKVPTSRLYPDGGAFLREPEDDPASLAGALFNITAEPDWHMNQETNALSLSAYGARLLMNGGWLGPPTRPAKLNNTLAINGADHTQRAGAGLEEGLTSDRFDYAAGLSGNALPGDASFTRSLLLVHGDRETDGYFLTLDEVSASEDDSIHTYFHPSTSKEPAGREPNVEYDATIDLFNRVKTNHLAVFYGSPPERVGRALVPSGSSRAGKPEHYRLEAVFPTEDDGSADLITVLFPYNDHHEKAEIRRVSGDQASGVSISHPTGVHDAFYAAQADVDQKIGDGTEFRGEAVFIREDGSVSPFYFVRQATLFRDGPFGFSSAKPVSLHLRGTRGRIWVAKPITVTFYHPGIAGVRVSGEALELTETGDGWVRAEVPGNRNARIRLMAKEGR